jgi:hypothetical protein
MSRGVIFGAVAFAVTFLLEREGSKLFERDFARYDALREMSGDPPFMREQFERAKGLIGWLLAEQSPVAGRGTRGLMQSMREDVVRYAKLEAM